MDPIELSPRESAIIREISMLNDAASRRMTDAVNLAAAMHGLPNDWQEKGFQLTLQKDGNLAFVTNQPQETPTPTP